VSPFVGDHRATREHGIEKFFLILEIIIQQGVVNFHTLRHVFQGHAVKTVLGEQVLGCIEYLFHCGGALLGFSRASRGFRVFGH